LFIIGIGNKPEDVKVLREALRQIAKHYGTISGYEKKENQGETNLFLQIFSGNLLYSSC
jgi:hypothetical protein